MAGNANPVMMFLVGNAKTETWIWFTVVPPAPPKKTKPATFWTTIRLPAGAAKENSPSSRPPQLSVRTEDWEGARPRFSMSLVIGGFVLGVVTITGFDGLPCAAAAS